MKITIEKRPDVSEEKRQYAEADDTQRMVLITQHAGTRPDTRATITAKLYVSAARDSNANKIKKPSKHGIAMPIMAFRELVKALKEQHRDATGEDLLDSSIG